MAGWEEILAELPGEGSQYDRIRRKYLNQLANYTKRSCIAYYSAFLTKRMENIDINDSDMSGFMNAVRNIDTDRGLDLILHTPGGDPTAAESIVVYLRQKFHNDIRVIVPHLAMSAGTLIACAAKEIVMGKHSSLGPVDPQFRGIPAFNIKAEFEEAKADLATNQANFIYWKLILEKYTPAFLKTTLDSIDLSEQLLRAWLGSCMFDSNIPEDSVKIDAIVNFLNEHDNSKMHARHFDSSKCRAVGLKIVDLESDQVLQDHVLSVHHAYIHTLQSTTSLKIIENHHGKAVVLHGTSIK